MFMSSCESESWYIRFSYLVGVLNVVNAAEQAGHSNTEMLVVMGGGAGWPSITGGIVAVVMHCKFVQPGGIPPGTDADAVPSRSQV
jgi:hypothetical protein